MAELNLRSSITNLKGVGPRRAQLYQRLGIRDLGALLSFYPRAYEDLTKIHTIREAPVGEFCVVRARVTAPVKEQFIRKGMVLYKTVVADTTGSMNITIFNNRYAAERLKAGEVFHFCGRISENLIRREMAAPEIEPPGPGRIRPVYRQTEGLPSRLIEAQIRQILEGNEEIADPLPDGLRRDYSLCHLRFALENIHQPASFEALEIARTRLIFEELLLLQLGMKQLKKRSREASGAVIFESYAEEFWELLPFQPTGAQRRAVEDCIADLHRPVPMNRLIQGDVGSGKTAVAAAVCHTMIRNGYQCAMMAPTEILAEQHARSLTRLFAGQGIRLALLTGSSPAKEKRKILEQLASGELDFIVGTHALIQDPVTFARLGLVVTDEQHRFGVAQRAALASKGNNPHLLVMSATPIPRTLALIIYGDLDISVLDELPPGRQKIETYAVSTEYRARIYKFIKKHLDEGFQVYIVCPLVEEGESELPAAREYSENLQTGEFSNYRVGLLHGRMKPAEKEEVMRAFAAGTIQILVSTTVVEVGVDVPNAVIMVVEYAERFGLSQLHQLRGRVGRGTQKSYCILISDSEGEDAKKRLKVMSETTDGFKIADEDLRQRGPGDFFGARQHGLPELKIADMMKNMDVLHLCARCASEILERDPSLSAPEHRLLQKQVKRLFEEISPQGLN